MYFQLKFVNFKIVRKGFNVKVMAARTRNLQETSVFSQYVLLGVGVEEGGGEWAVIGLPGFIKSVGKIMQNN